MHRLLAHAGRACARALALATLVLLVASAAQATSFAPAAVVVSVPRGGVHVSLFSGPDFTSNGIDFVSPMIVANGDSMISLTVSGNLYVYAPGELTADAIHLQGDSIVLDSGANLMGTQAELCNMPGLCLPVVRDSLLQTFDLEGDVVLTLAGALEFVELRAGGTILLSNTVVPEPGTAALLGVGLAGLGVARRRSAPGTPAVD